MSQPLIVPIDIAALCVGQTDVNGSAAVPYGTKDFARLAADFSMIPYLNAQAKPVNKRANVSADMLASPFNSVDMPLGEGIHIHWALPDALSRGTSGPTGSISFPEAPNRWLVVRVATNNAVAAQPVTSVKGWIVESDTLWDPRSSLSDAPPGSQLHQQNLASRAVPIQPVLNMNTLPNQAYQAMGRIFGYESWKETPGDPAIPKNTALGYGTPSYAAAYAHCANVFGLHDPMTDLDLTRFPPETTRISYMVAGWYESAAKDPLATMTYPAGATNAQKLAAVNSALKWTFPIDASAVFPTSTLCCGLLTSIKWDPVNTHYINKRPDKGPGTEIDIAIGNSTAEALSAMIASRPQFATTANVERLLNALQLNVLSKLGAPDGLAKLEEALHQNGFGATSAGTIWTIKRTVSGGTSGGAPVTGDELLDVASTLEESLPPDIALALDAINASQAQSDRMTFEINSLRGQIFIDWYKYMILEYPTGAPQPTKLVADDAFRYIKNEVKELNARLAAQGLVNTKLKRQLDELTEKLNVDKKYSLSSVGSPRNWHAAEPVLLFSGADVKPARRYGGDGAYDQNGYFLCRLSSSLISAMSVAGTTYKVVPANLPKLPSSPSTSYTTVLATLFGEAFFLDTNQAWVVAAAVAAQGGAGNPAVSNLAAFVTAIQNAQKALLTNTTGSSTTGPITFTGIPPSPAGIKPWSPPWIPIMLQWEVRYYPFKSLNTGGSGTSTYPSNFITSGYRLGRNSIELIYQQPVPSQLPQSEVYSGTTLLTGNTEINLKSQIDLYIRTHPDDRNNAVLRQIRDTMQLSMMAQTLDGFNQALVMRRQTLQLPVFDPLGRLNGRDRYNFSNVLVRDAVADRNDYAPIPISSYSPLRAGYMTISRLRIIDVFGQVREIRNPNVIRSEMLIPAGDNPQQPVVGLPPRLAQPSRLQFRWIAAGSNASEMNSDPASSPIFGWVLFNHLDSNLMIYDAAGSALGSFNTQGPFWQGAPGDNATYNRPIADVFANANPHLKAFALGIAANPNARDFLVDMLAAIDRTATMIEPGSYQKEQGLAVLIGRPLALVRASLGLELEGQPAINQSWDAFAKAVQDYKPDMTDMSAARDNGAFPKVRFAVRLGDLSQVNDGLIGYFVEDGTANAFRTFYAAASKKTSHGVIPPAYDRLTVAGDATVPPIFLTMMVDPRAVVHATTGFLPVKSIGIPPYMYGNALSKMAVTFLTAPVLTSLASLALPVPNESGFAWSWVMNNPTANTWDVTTQIKAIDSQAGFAGLPQRISDGWLKLNHTGTTPATSNTKATGS